MTPPLVKYVLRTSYTENVLRAGQLRCGPMKVQRVAQRRRRMILPTSSLQNPPRSTEGDAEQPVYCLGEEHHHHLVDQVQKKFWGLAM